MRAVRSLAALAVLCVAVSACQSVGSGQGAAAPATSSSPSAPPPSAAPPSDNGISSQSGAQIARRAVQALAQATSVHVTGFIAENGQRVTYDVVTQGAIDGTGTLTGNGETVRITRVGGNDYAKASTRFWNTFGPEPLPPGAAAMAGGKYVKADHDGERLAILTKFLDVSRVIGSELADETAVAKGARQVVDGVPTIAITSADLGTIYVATVGQPYIVRAVAPDGAAAGVTDFAGYNANVTVALPPAAQTIDFATLSG